MPQKTIVIVGGGAGGAAIFVQLSERLIKEKIFDYKIILIEKATDVGRGLAYTPKFDDCILNMTYRDMSLTPERPNDTVEWFAKNQKKWKSKYPDYNPDKDDHPPRSLYGLYVEDALSDSYRNAIQNGLQVGIISGMVLDIEKIPCLDNSFHLNVKLEDGRIIQASKVVLALGNFPPTTFKELRGEPGYFPSFWPEDKVFDIIPKDATIVVLGTRLTAIDVAMTLLSHGFTGKIILTARQGLLPKVKYSIVDEPNETIYKKVEKIKKNGQIKLSELIPIIREELEKVFNRKIDFEEIASPKGTPIEILKKDIAAAQSGFSDKWGTVLNSAGNYLTAEWWKFFSDEDKAKFRKDYASLWFVYRSPMPLKNAVRLLGLLESGHLEIVSGLKSVVYDHGKELFVLDYGTKKLEVKYIINATDIGLDVNEIDSVLMQNLIKRGILRPYKFGGVDVDFETCKLINDNKLEYEPIYFTGYLTRGVHFQSNCIPSIRRNANRIVESLIKSLLGR